MSVNVARLTIRSLQGLGAALIALTIAGAALGVVVCRRFDASMAFVYPVPIPTPAVHSDAATLARGAHLAQSIGGCTGNFCHGADLAGGEPIDMGPLGTIAGPNITPAGGASAYSDGELARLITDGIRRDGRSVRFMPSQAFGWMPDGDVAAIVAYLRTVPPIVKPNRPIVLTSLAKVLDRIYDLPLDVARRIDHSQRASVPPAADTAAYGAVLARLCTGCHGDHLSGGRMPGAPPTLPSPLNLTPDGSGLKDWTFADFETVMRKGRRKNGENLDPFMTIDEWRNLDDVEMRALWAYLREIPARPFGEL